MRWVTFAFICFGFGCAQVKYPTSPLLHSDFTRTPTSVIINLKFRNKRTAECLRVAEKVSGFRDDPWLSFHWLSFKVKAKKGKLKYKEPLNFRIEFGDSAYNWYGEGSVGRWKGSEWVLWGSDQFEIIIDGIPTREFILKRFADHEKKCLVKLKETIEAINLPFRNLINLNALQANIRRIHQRAAKNIKMSRLIIYLEWCGGKWFTFVKDYNFPRIEMKKILSPTLKKIIHAEANKLLLPKLAKVRLRVLHHLSHTPMKNVKIEIISDAPNLFLMYLPKLRTLLFKDDRFDFLIKKVLSEKRYQYFRNGVLYTDNNGVVSFTAYLPAAYKIKVTHPKYHFFEGFLDLSTSLKKTIYMVELGEKVRIEGAKKAK
ncbi:MAG: hypothetical protein DRP02_12555 [Candidatus Gerdarchaeota archaeon]|nr:MAG: hypothetical protein DRP02_12555 [Candidatus Gerdarchaeota archaeon]